jgi:hypothetical protein
MKHTAVDWLFNQFQRTGIYPKYSVDNGENNSKQDLIHTLIEQAKAMEKEQINEAYANGSNDRLRNFINEQYYTDTFKSE